MAASGTTSSRSGGMFKLYVFVWAIAAAAALAYLASLLTSPELAKGMATQAQNDPDNSTRLASRALTEVGNIRRSVAEIQRDVSQIKEGLEQRDSAERQLQTRLSVLEERVSGIATPPVASNTPPPAQAKQKTAEKPAEKPDRKKDAKAEERASRVARLDKLEDSDEAEPRVETGSITPPAPAKTQGFAPVVTFGTPVVTPAKSGNATFAVQIGAGNSREALRHSWNQLAGKHAALQGLEPRILAPKTDGGKFRLMAGPFASRADADKVCGEMGVGRNGCFSTVFGGQPL